jgi:hypothetical protein
MVEILGGNLKTFMDSVGKDYEAVEITYAGKDYEVWEISDELLQRMRNMPEDEFFTLAGKDAWWRWSSGSVLGTPNQEAFINGELIVCWDNDYYLPDEYEDAPIKHFDSLTQYLCDCVGASQPKNVCALSVDLAKYNGISMAELFGIYEGTRYER